MRHLIDGPFVTLQDLRNYAAAVHFRQQAWNEGGTAYRAALSAYVGRHHGTPAIADAIRTGVDGIDEWLCDFLNCLSVEQIADEFGLEDRAVARGILDAAARRGLTLERCP